jgi:hypothetical protein
MTLRMSRPAVTTPIQDPSLIPAVHRYCDEWCARCPVTARCLVRRLLLEREKRHGTSYDMSLEEIIEFTHEVAAAEGRTTPELDALLSPDPAVRARVPEVDNPLTRLGARYAMEADWYLRSCGWTPPSSPDTPDPSLLDVLAWYHVFIRLRIDRAVTSHLQAVRGRQDRLEDALGCAKLVLVSLDRSREALEGLQRESGEPYIGRMLTTLSELTQMMEVRFPAARSFVRAGLDGPHEAAGVAAARRGA